jgi:hypothetical protein
LSEGRGGTIFGPPRPAHFRLLPAAGGAVLPAAFGTRFGALLAASAIAALGGVLGGCASDHGQGRDRDEGAEDQFMFHMFFRFVVG